MRSDYRSDAEKLESIALLAKSRANSTSVADATYSAIDEDEDMPSDWHEYEDEDEDEDSEENPANYSE